MKQSNIYGFCLALTILLNACGGNVEKPIDGKTRLVIDSIAQVEQRKAKMEVDSICAADRRTQLPRLVDSIKQIRLREIAEKMKTVPK